MTTKSLEEILRKSGRFTLFLTDGRKIDIPHPEFVWLVPPEKTILIISHGRHGPIEHLRVNQIVSISFPRRKAA